MKNLDKKSKEIFFKIYSHLKEEEYTELNNLDGEFKPLCVEKKGTVWVNCIKWEKISIRRYYIKMDEYYFSPELIILYSKYFKNFICPVYYKYDDEDLQKENIRYIKNWLISINNNFKL